MNKYICHICNITDANKKYLIEHGHEQIHCCSYECKQIFIQEHKDNCLTPCILLKKCSKCGERFLKRNCMMVLSKYYCLNCRINTNDRQTKPKKRRAKYAYKDISMLLWGYKIHT